LAFVGGARMIRVLHLADPAQRREAEGLRAAAAPPASVAASVSAIVADVCARGDDAVRELTARFDGARLGSLFLDEARWDALAAQCPPPVRAALELAHKRVRAFHAPQVAGSYTLQLEGGGVLRCLTPPL